MRSRGFVTGRFRSAALLATTVVAASTTGFGAAPAHAAFPGVDGPLLFERSGNMFTATGSGTAYTERQLTSTGVDRNGRWSSDGRRIALNTKGGNLVVVNADGSGRRVVVRGQSYQPAWSPPGAPGATGPQLAFVRVTAPREPGEIYAVPAAGGAVRRLATDAGTCGNSRPAWSPSGALVAYLHEAPDPRGGCAGNFRVRILDPRTSRVTEVPPLPAYYGDARPNADTRPLWTAGGRHVVFTAVDSCLAWVMAYDVTTGAITEASEPWVGCEGGDYLSEAVPTPSGRFAFLYSYLGGPLDDGGSCVSAPVTSRCSFHPGPDGWGSLDVQPLT